MSTIFVQKAYKVVLFSFIFLGAFLLRWQYVAEAEYPLNDGGFFYQMTIELIENGFRLPAYTAYNHSQIPYAYPPFGLYLSGAISTLFQIDLLKIFLWLPLLINLLALPFVFLFAEKLMGNFTAGFAAAAFWSFSLPSYEYLIMAGGITRSPAYTASIISLYFFYTYLKTEKNHLLIIATIFGGITALSHLEIFSVHILSILVLAFLAKQYHRKTFITLLLYFAGCGVLAAPYVFSVIKVHGLTPFTSAAGSVDFSLAPAVVRLLLFNFTKEYSLTITAVLGLIGFITLLLRRKPAYLIWLILMILADPSNADRSALLPLSILASIGLHDAVIPALARIRSEKQQSGEVKTDTHQEFALITGISLFLYVFLLAYFRFYTQEYRWNSVITTDVQAFDWIDKNTGQDDTFLLLPHKYSWQHDGVSEWFPALSGRKSLLTVQGAEWLPGDYHAEVEQRYTDFHDCFETNCDCLSATLKKLTEKPDFLWVSTNDWPAKTNACIAPLIMGSTGDYHYQKSYENEGVVIFSLQY